MSAHRILFCFAIAVYVLAGPLPAEAQDYVIAIPQADVTTYTPTEQDSIGQYFFLKFTLPGAVSGKKLDLAILEFYVNVDAYERESDLYTADDTSPHPEGDPDDHVDVEPDSSEAEAEKPTAFLNDTPTIEVFAPKAAFSGALGSDKLEMASHTPLPVLAGENRRVVIDITHIIQPIIDGTSTNQGLVIGSITGLREGKFTLLSGKLGGGAVARISLHPFPEE